MTGENEKALREIVDFTRLAAILVLLLHFYFYCYGSFREWGFTAPVGDRFLLHISRTGIFNSIYYSKSITLGLLLISLVGAKGRKEVTLRRGQVLLYIILGLTLFSFSHFLLEIHPGEKNMAILYMITTTAGFLMVLAGGTQLSRYISMQLQKDIFNELNETFPQEERLIQNEYSVNLPAVYQLRGKYRKSWINIINPFRGILVIGSPGSGKSWFIIQHVVRQHIRKGFSMLLYDYKYDDLAKIAYNTWLHNQRAYKVRPSFHLVHFDDPDRSHRCNPLDPLTMSDITDATESSRSILLGLNRAWISRQGDFFVESPINFLTAIIWFLKKYQKGRYCTLPHAIELMQVEYDDLFPVLGTEKEIEVLLNPFVSAQKNRAMEQLEGQVASAKIALARLSSPRLYWVLSGNDFTLDINNPEAPKILCLAGNTQKQQVYGAVLSLYVNRLVKLVNQKNKAKCSLVFDEFPTLFLSGMDSLMATARSNKVATCLGLQDFSQLKKQYGRDESSVIMNIAGNILSGQVTGETARALSERFGKIIQVKESVSVHRNDTSISQSSQLEYAIPSSKIAGLSSGEFVGMVTDDPQEKIKLKTFHAQILNDEKGLEKERRSYKELPVLRRITPEMIHENYEKVKREVEEIIQDVREILTNTPGFSG